MPIIVRNKRTFNKSDFKGKTVYIGRGSPFGNPYLMKNNNQAERLRVIEKFKKLFYSEKGFIMRGKARELAQKHENICLLCYCYPLPCHGDIIKEYMERVV